MNYVSYKTKFISLDSSKLTKMQKKQNISFRLFSSLILYEQMFFRHVPSARLPSLPIVNIIVIFDLHVQCCQSNLTEKSGWMQMSFVLS